MVRRVDKWACGICSTIYDKKEHATLCEKQGIPDFPDKIAVGDFVTTVTAVWNEDPKTPWAIKVPDGPGWAQLLLVTDVTVEGHRKSYHLFCAKPRNERATNFVNTYRNHAVIALLPLELVPPDLVAWAAKNVASWHHKRSPYPL